MGEGRVNTYPSSVMATSTMIRKMTVIRYKNADTHDHICLARVSLFNWAFVSVAWSSGGAISRASLLQNGILKIAVA